MGQRASLFVNIDIDVFRMRILAEDVVPDLFRHAFNFRASFSIHNVDGDQQYKLVSSDVHRTDIVDVPDSSVFQNN